MTYLEIENEGTWQKHLKRYSQHNTVEPYPSSMSQTSCSRKKPPRWKNIHTHNPMWGNLAKKIFMEKKLFHLLGIYSLLYETLCAIWYHLYNLKNRAKHRI